MLFHIFCHIQPNHRFGASVQFPSQRPAQFCFSHTRRTCQQNSRHRATGITEVAKPPSDRFRHFLNRFRLTDHLFFQICLQMQQAFPLIRSQPSHRDARAGRYRPGYIRRCHHPRSAAFRLPFRQPLHFIPQLRRLFELTFPHRIVKFLLQLFSGSMLWRAKLLHSCMSCPLIQ